MPQLSRTTRCRGCGAEIAFIKTEKGKSMPVDPEAIEFIPDNGYSVFVMPDGSVKRGIVQEEAVKKAEVQIGYRSHFSSCPAADQFHRKNKSERTRK